MPASVEIDPAESALTYFASEVRRLRAEAGLTQKQLADLLHFAVSYVGMIETAARVPSQQFAIACDKKLNGQGVLTRLWPLVNRQAYPKNFASYVDLEASATAIRSYQPHVVDGLVQTEEYARAILRLWHDAHLDSLVAARMERQRVFQREAPPFFSLLLDESVLRRPTGGDAVMRRQLSQLLEFSQRAKTFIRVLPVGAMGNYVLDGPIAILSFTEGEDVAYLENYDQRQLIGTVEDVQVCHARYAAACADALTPEESRDLIASLLEDPHPWATRYRT